jgi:hypothetical protein
VLQTDEDESLVPPLASASDRARKQQTDYAKK